MLDTAKRIGCWSVGLLAVAAFFALGAIVSLLNGDILTVLQGLLLAVVVGAVAIWVGRRKMRGG
jgi:hypothetical protein